MLRTSKTCMMCAQVVVDCIMRSAALSTGWPAFRPRENGVRPVRGRSSVEAIPGTLVRADCEQARGRLWYLFSTQICAARDIPAYHGGAKAAWTQTPVTSRTVRIRSTPDRICKQEKVLVNCSSDARQAEAGARLTSVPCTTLMRGMRVTAIRSPRSERTGAPRTSRKPIDRMLRLQHACVMPCSFSQSEIFWP